MISTTSVTGTLNDSTQPKADVGTTIRMKEYIELTLCTQYKGEALLQRLLHIITTTTITLSSMSKTVSDADDKLNMHQKDEIFEILQTACQSYINFLQVVGNVVRYNDFYQYHYQHLILPLLASYSDSSSTLVPPYDSSWVAMTQQQQQELTQHHMESTLLDYAASSPGSASFHAVLQQRLHTAQSHLNKDAIRLAYMNLALYYMTNYNHNQNTTPSPAQGDPNEYYCYYYTDAIQMSLRSLEYCSSRYHTTLHTILLLVVALYKCNCNTSGSSNNNNFALISDYIRRIQHNLNDTPSAAPGMLMDASTTSVIESFREKVDTISALERIHYGDYSSAALKLRSIVIQISNRSSGSAATTTTTKSSVVVGSSSTHATRGTSGTVGTTNNITTIEQLIQDENWDALVLSPEDIILYATVLTLAVNLDQHKPTDDMILSNNNHHNRKVGLSFLLDHPNMKSLLCERTPFAYDILVSYYVKSDYRHTYALLQQYAFPILQYDLYLTQVNYTSSTIGSNNKTHLQILQSMIRTKFMVLYWNVYVECPLVSMMESLGSGITGTNNVQEFETSIVQLLKNRFVVLKQSSPTESSPNQINFISNAIMTFPMDTRYDYIHKKIVRANHIYSHSSDIDQLAAEEQVQLYYTTLQYHRTTQRVLDDTYSMLVRVSCIENDIVIQAPDLSTAGGGNSNNKSRRGGGYRAYQQQQQPSIQNYEMNAAALEQPQSNIHSVDVDDEDDDKEEMIHNDIDEDDVDDDDFEISMDHNNAMNPEDMY